MMVLGGIEMIIKKIGISNLHGEYNYKISFDNQLTFLYGPNGCGKTTILNILSSVVTGKIYHLVNYIFDRIILDCVDENNKYERIEISMNNNGKNIRTMKISFKNRTNSIADIDNFKEAFSNQPEADEMEKYFFSKYPLTKEIKEAFNYVYLPLSRYGVDRYDNTDSGYYQYIKRRYYYDHPLAQNTYNTYLNESLQYVSELIRDSCAKINYEENRVNDKFRKEILSSSISVSGEIHIMKILKDIEQFKWDDVLKSKKVYIKTLNDIDVYDDSMQTNIELFFKKFENAYMDYKKHSNDRGAGIGIDFAWQYAEFQKIQSIAGLAKEYEKRKEDIRKPKELFLEVLNDFFRSSGSDKKIKITSGGQVVFDTHNKRLQMSDLSSGEKQIVITFASLIFGLTGNKKGIFIVDEPEASLHLEWQSKFVSSILSTNKNIQMIFATHSPELIGRYRDKAVKLIRV